MGERQSPERLECPYIDTCTAPVTQQQYETYCKELTLNPHKEPNYMSLRVVTPTGDIVGCPSYYRLEQTPRAWRRRMEMGLDDAGAGSARRR
jgi:hypothetical protein